MSKRHRNLWDDEPYEFKPDITPPPNLYNQDENEAEFLEEAHEALSKLFNKTNKRARQMKGVRRKDAWQ